MTDYLPPRMPAIPFPEPTMPSVLATLVSLKGAVEMLLGTRMNTPSNRVYIQDTEPTGMAGGDLWITVQPKSTISFWTGAAWQVFAVAHPDGTLHTS